MNATYFSVDFEDRITRPTNSPLTAFVDRDLIAGVITDNPTVDQVNDFLAPVLAFDGFNNATGMPFDPASVEAIFDNRIQNLSATSVSGIDISVTYDLTSSIGDIGLTLNGSYLLEFENRVTPQSPADETLDTFLNPIDLRLRAGANWRKDGFSAAAFADYQDSYVNDIFVPPSKIEAWTTIDVNLAYDTGDRFDTWIDNTTLSFNVRNLFNEYPPSIGEDLDLLGRGLIFPVTYDPSNGSVLGRFISFDIGKTF